MKKSLFLAVFTCRALCAFGVEAPHEHEPLPNFDRRLNTPPAAETPAAAKRMQAAQALQARMRDVRVDRDPITKSPQWIASAQRFLTGPDGEGGAVQAATAAPFAKGDPQRAVKAFLNEHREIFGHDATALAGATLTRDDVSPSGLHTFVWQQAVNGIPVFAGVLKAGLTPRGELVNIGSQFVAAPREPAPGAPRITARQAVVLAAKEIGTEVNEAAVIAQDATAGAPQRQKFAAPGLTDPRTELTLLPMDESTLRLCWSVILMSRARGEMYRVLVDADTGGTQVRQCLTEYLSDASYRVFTSDSPSPMSPGLATPGSAQPPLVPRTVVTTPALNTTASPNGWIDDGVNETRGNNVDAHTDVDHNNQPDLPRPQGSPSRVFDFPLDLTQDPSAYRDAAVTNLFYWCNRIHDRFYELGFTESAGNFQNDNFGRGGVASDAILADAQDGSGTENANFSSPPDGSPGRVQMFLWPSPSPARDGDFDAEVIIHECTHGLSNRLVGGGAGIFAGQTRGMGEGWSDFYALSLLSEAGDDVDGTYAEGGYVMYQLSPDYVQNYYFGIRRYPYTTDLAKNPLTFKDIDPAQASPHAGVPLTPLDTASNANPTEVHNIGEVWCVTLWEARANLIRKHGFPAGNDLILQLVTDGMKLSPVDPNFLQARDAILQADQVLTNSANRNELWAAFAKRGMGAGAISPASSYVTGLVENYDPPDDLNVVPLAPFVASGDLGGPFAPGAQTYTLANYGTAALSWTAAAPPWLTLNAVSGALAPGESVDVVATFNTNANVLEIGAYTQSVTFHNAASGANLTRTVGITVNPPRVYYFPLDTDPGWSRTGEWAFGVPLGGGGAHPFENLVGYPDPTSGATGSNVYGVNLAGNYTLVAGVAYYLTTTALDCSGLTSTTLRFKRWLNTADQALLEGSSDGVTWTTIASRVNGLDVTDSVWVTRQYDIAALADHQPTVFIRWGYLYDSHLNVYGSKSTGWNIDDIEILGAPNNLNIDVPAAITEGDAPTTGTVTASPAPVDDLVVNLIASDPARLSLPVSVTILAGTTTANFPIAVVDDALLNGSESLAVRPSAFKWSGHGAAIVVHDNETATLGVTLPATATEGDGSVIGTVTVSAPVASGVIVQLVSSAPGEAAPPPTVTIPAGQTNVSFPLAIIDDTRIDGPQVVTITASVVHWTPGNGTITVLDNEATNLTLTAPLTTVTEGDANTWEAIVAISGTLPVDLVVTLASDDTTEITVPASVTIPAGQTSATFNFTVVDDSETDGTQIAHISASAPGFTPASLAFTIRDNDPAYFVISPIANPLVRGMPVIVTITAKDVNGETETKYGGRNAFGQNVVTRTATGDVGTVPTVTNMPSGFRNGVWAFSLTINTFATNVILTASEPGGHTGTSNVFDVGTGPLDHFVWDAIAPAQTAGVPFAATVRAFDAGGNPVTGFHGTANLATVVVQPPTGTGTTPSQLYPFPGGGYSSSRVQTLYLANNLPGAKRLTALALNVTQVPGGAYFNCTIRLKQTAEHFTTAWEPDGWTIVHVSNAKFTSAGWVTFPFPLAFDYDGTSNLLVDISYNNPDSFFALGFGSCATSSYSGSPRVLRGYSTMAGSDPFSWGNDPVSDPSPLQQFGLLNLQFTAAAPVAMQPVATTPFVNGVWTGNLTLPASGGAVSVRADDGAGHVGGSGTFTVSPTDADSDGLLDAWERRWWGTTVGHAALDDFDGDGIPELLEMAFGLDPTKPDSAALPPVVAEDGYLTITIVKQPGVIYEVQTAGDLEPGSFSAGTTTVLVDDATTLKVRDNFLIGPPSARFLRVKVTAAP